MLMSATMAGLGTVGCSAKALEPSRPFSSPATATKTMVRFGWRAGVQRLGGLDHRRDAGGVVHGPVVDAVALDGLADAQVVEVGGDHDVLRLQRRVGPGSTPTTLGDARRAVSVTTLGLQRLVQRETGQGLVGVGQRQQLGEAVAGAGEQRLGLFGVQRAR